jgi:hypothetical protein
VLAPATWAAQAPRPKRGLAIGLTIGFVLLLLLAGGGYVLYQRYYSDPTKDAMAGDCLADLPVVPVGEDREVKTARVVGCDDPAAVFVVEGRLDRLSPEQASSPQICQAYQDATFIYRGPARGTGYVLCLRQVDG